MTEDKFIESIKMRNRLLFQAEELKMTPNSLENQLRGAFRSGVIEGLERSLPKRAEPSLFESIFGKRDR